MKYMKYRNTNKYFPKYLDISLLVCTKDCGRVWLGPSKFEHICGDCGKKMKYLYRLKYELISDNYSNNVDLYKDWPLLPGNNNQSLKWIDDISYSDLINGKVDCLGDIDIIYIAFATCEKKCGYYSLLYDGAIEICPKCGKNQFRWVVKAYKRVKDDLN